MTDLSRLDKAIEALQAAYDEVSIIRAGMTPGPGIYVPISASISNILEAQRSLQKVVYVMEKTDA